MFVLRSDRSILASAVVALITVIGCRQNPPTDTPPPMPEVGVRNAAEARQEDAQGTSAENPTPQPPEPAAESGSSASASNRTAAASPKETVLLGSPELTAGIPGNGPLKLEEVRAWLEKPENHSEFEVLLPLGLDKGQAQMKGVDKTPLTRAKIELGRQLYFDPRLSKDGTISCASCHDPNEGWARHTQFGIGINGQTGGRNSPVSYNRILSEAQFWDGRASSLEEQAKGPIANPIEMGNTHEQCVATLSKIPGYAAEFDKIFGELTIETVAQAIASFERSVVTAPSPFDYHEELRPYLGLDLGSLKEDDPDTYAAYEKAKAAADAHPMSESAIRGREIFFTNKGNCTACHVGPNLTDEQYHNLGIGMDKPEPDLGRYNVTNQEKDKGAFKTPTIRNVALTAPYMHDGSQKTLAEVVEWYDKGGHPNAWLSDRIKPLKLSEQDRKDLVAFMEACTSAFPPVETGRLPE